MKKKKKGREVQFRGILAAKSVRGAVGRRAELDAIPIEHV
jgi:hypothetical protein